MTSSLSSAGRTGRWECDRQVRTAKIEARSCERKDAVWPASPACSGGRGRGLMAPSVVFCLLRRSYQTRNVLLFFGRVLTVRAFPASAHCIFIVIYNGTCGVHWTAPLWSE